MYALRYVTVSFSFFFKVAGSVLLVSNALKIVSSLTKCECDDKIADFITPCLDFAYFIVVIWGSVLVFGKYSLDFYAASSLISKPVINCCLIVVLLK